VRDIDGEKEKHIYVLSAFSWETERVGKPEN
jgi:hypothetical protein